jgi:hypothetical protein
VQKQTTQIYDTNAARQEKWYKVYKE